MTKVILFLACCLLFTHYAPACDDQRMQQLARKAEFVVLAEVVEVKPAPGFWSGQFAAVQYVRYKLIRSLKGNLTAREIDVGHYVVKNSLTADKDHARLSPGLFKVGNRLILFIDVDRQHKQEAEPESGRGRFVSLDENCGAVLATEVAVRQVIAKQ